MVRIGSPIVRRGMRKGTGGRSLREGQSPDSELLDDNYTLDTKGICDSLRDGPPKAQLYGQPRQEVWGAKSAIKGFAHNY